MGLAKSTEIAITMEEFKITVDEITYRGTVKIEGESTLKFTVYYKDQSQTDDNTYRPDQIDYLMIRARQVLFELVSQDITVF